MRRFSLAELLAVAGVVIAGLTLWNSWSERRQAADEKVAAAAEDARLDLAATPANGGRRLALSGGGHELAEVTVAFPRALGVGARRPATPEIDADWFAAPLLKRTDGGADTADGVLPVLVTARYWDGGRARTAAGVYDLAWATEGRVLRGRVLRLTGLRLRERDGNAAALERAWAARGF